MHPSMFEQSSSQLKGDGEWDVLNVLDQESNQKCFHNGHNYGVGSE